MQLSHTASGNSFDIHKYYQSHFPCIISTFAILKHLILNEFQDGKFRLANPNTIRLKREERRRY